MNPPTRKLLRTAFTLLTALSVVGYVALGGVYYPLWTSPEISINRAALIFCEPNSFDYEIWDWLIGKQPYAIFTSSYPKLVVVPLWPFVALMILACTNWYYRDWRERHRPGFCPKCGYDLRATPDRCPECGHQPIPMRR